MQLLDRCRNLGTDRGTTPSDRDGDDHERKPQKDTPVGGADGHRKFSCTRLSDFAAERSLAIKSAGSVNAVCRTGGMLSFPRKSAAGITGVSASSAAAAG
jgi:hypothetical protein